MSSREIEHVVLRPTQFEILLTSVQLKDAAGRRLTSTATRVLPLEDPLDRVLMTRLIPGGRFLLTSSDRGEVKFWDLGFGDDSPYSAQPLETIRLSGPVLCLLVQAYGENSFILTTMTESDVQHNEL